MLLKLSVSLVMLAMVLVGCEKDGGLSEDAVTQTPQKFKDTPSSRTFDPDNCPNKGDECCQAPEGDCAAITVVVTPSIRASLDDLANDSDGSSQSTDEIFTYLESHQEELNLSGNLLSQLDDQEVLTMDKFDNGTHDYYPIAGDGDNQIYILAVKE